MSLHNGRRGKRDDFFANGNSSVDWPTLNQNRGRSRIRDRSVGSTSRKGANKSCERSKGSLSKAFYDRIDLSYRDSSSSSSSRRSSSRSFSPRQVSPTDGSIVDRLPRSQSRCPSKTGDKSEGSMSRKSRGKSGEKCTGSLSRAFYGTINMSFKRSSSIKSRVRNRSRSKSPKIGGPTGDGIVNFLPRRLSRGRSINGDRSVGSMSRRSRSKSGERSTDSLSQTLYDILDLSREGYSNLMPRSRSRSKSPAILAQVEGRIQNAFDVAQPTQIAGIQYGNRKPSENMSRFKLQLSRGSSRDSGPRERKHRDAKHKPSENLRHNTRRRRSQSSDSVERRPEDAKFTSSETSSDSAYHVSRCRSQSPRARCVSQRYGRRQTDIKTKASTNIFDSRHRAIRDRRKCFETASPPGRHEVAMIKNTTPSGSLNDTKGRHRNGSPNKRVRPPRSTRNQPDFKTQRHPTGRQKQPLSQSSRPISSGRRYQVHLSPQRHLMTCKEDDDNSLNDWPISPLPSDIITCYARRSSFTSELTCSVSSLTTDPSSVKSSAFGCSHEKLTRANSVPVNCDEKGYWFQHKGFRMFNKTASGRIVQLHDSCSVCTSNESLVLDSELPTTKLDDLESYTKQADEETFDNNRSLNVEDHSNVISICDQTRGTYKEQAPNFPQPLGVNALSVPPFISFHDDSESSSSDSRDDPNKWRMLLGRVKSASCHQHDCPGETATKSTCRSSFVSGSSDSKSQYVFTHEYEKRRNGSSWSGRESKLLTNDSLIPSRRNH